MSKRPQEPEGLSPQPTGQQTPTGLFPHYTRLFSATNSATVMRLAGKLFLWSLLIISIGVNIFAYNPDFFKQIFPRDNDKATNKVLGVSDPVEPGIDKSTTRNEYEYWLGIIQDHPDYRDAHVYAAISAYKLGNNEEAKGHLAKVYELDPNYTGLPALKDLLSPR